MGHRWRPIEDVPEDYLALTDHELDPLLEIWKEQQERLRGEGLLHKFNRQMQRGGRSRPASSKTCIHSIAARPRFW